MEAANNLTYDVSVGVQPDGHRCVVENGSGRINDANVADVIVRCAPSGTIEVKVGSFPNSANLMVKVFSRRDGLEPPQLIGFAGSIEIVNNVAQFVVSDSEGGADAIQLMEGETDNDGKYDFYLFTTTVNERNSQNQIIYDTDDKGIYIEVRIRSGIAYPVTVDNNSLGNLRRYKVKATSPNNDFPDAPMSCSFSPPNTLGSTTPSLSNSEAAIVGVARRVCTEDCSMDSFGGTSGYETNYPAYLPIAIYDIFCHVDTNENGSVDSGDFVGKALNTFSESLTLTRVE
jgi:hypothetical protein